MTTGDQDQTMEFLSVLFTYSVFDAIGLAALLEPIFGELTPGITHTMDMVLRFALVAAAYFWTARTVLGLETPFLALSSVIDTILTGIAKVGAWAGLFLVLVVVFDVISRYYGTGKETVGAIIGTIFNLGPDFELNSTKVQESEYWLHTFLFSLCIGYAYIKQSHVRIDLVRDRFSMRTKYMLEMLGCAILLLPFTLMTMQYHWNYALASYEENEISKSVIGLSNLWVLKAALPLLFFLLFLAALSQLIKSYAGYTGSLPSNKIAETLGGDN